MKRFPGAVLPALLLLLAWGGAPPPSAGASFFAETAVQTHRGDPYDSPVFPCDPGDAPCQQYYGNGVFERDQGLGQLSTTSQYTFVDPVLPGNPQRSEYAYGSADLASSQLRAAIQGDLQASIPGGAITLALAALSDSTTLDRFGGPPFGTRSGDLVTFTLTISGSMSQATQAGAAFNGSIVSLIVARKGTISPDLLFQSPNYICSFYWGLGADADVIYNFGASRLPLQAKLTSFPATVTASCPAGREFDWAIVVRPSMATFAPGNWSFDFQHTIDYQVNVPPDVDMQYASGIVPPVGPIPVERPLDHYMAYKTRSPKGDICTADSPANAGKSCQVEEDCGGSSSEEDETGFCVPNKFAKGLRATLSGVFESDALVYDIKKPLALCAPAEKNDEGVLDPDTHLRSYLIALTKGRCAADATANAGLGCVKDNECCADGDCQGRKKVCAVQPKPVKRTGLTVVNQFHSGESPLQIDAIKPDRLLVPTSKGHTEPVSLPDVLTVDHYRCYKVALTKGSGKFGPITGVSVNDQFTDDGINGGKKLFDLKKPSRLCMAVAKNGESIVNPAVSLLCYTAAPVKGQPKHVAAKGLFLGNQFGVEQADTVKEEELCVPSVVDPGSNPPLIID